MEILQNRDKDVIRNFLSFMDSQIVQILKSLRLRWTRYKASILIRERHFKAL